MSLRDYFAAAALTGFIQRKDFQLFPLDGAELAATLAASNAYEIADAMLAQREKGGT